MMQDQASEPVRLTVAAAYLLQGEHACHECGCFVPVFGLMVQGPFEAEGHVHLDADDDSALLRLPGTLPRALADAITDLSGGHFRMDFSRTVDDSYWMNHCRECDAKIGDWFVHKAGEAFFPTTDAEVTALRGQRLEGPFTLDSPELAVSSWTSRWLKVASED